MNIREFIEMMQEEERINPHATIKVRIPPMILSVTEAGASFEEDIDVVECHNNGQQVIIIAEQ